MKFSLSNSLSIRSQCAYHLKLLRHFFSSNFEVSTKTSSSSTRSSQLYRRISPIGDPRVSVVPVLDQWVLEGRSVCREELQRIIIELKSYKRFKHALEISQWMTDKRYIPLTSGDVATRLNLISRVHGLEQAENYFSNIPQQLEGFEVYTALLNCYAQHKSVEKAESVIEKLRDMGCARTALSYNILMNLYYRIGCWDKLDSIMQEMEEKSIFYDNYTYAIRLSAYAEASDSEGINEIVARMESDPRILLDCNTYAVAANGYLKLGSVEKALTMTMINKLEGLTTRAKRRNVAFDFLLKLYAETGKKDELYRIWNMYKKKEKIYNKGYVSMMNALVKVNDVEGAEKILKEWESTGLSYDFRIPHFLINAYCKNGLLGKAEALLNGGIAKGGDPLVNTWFCLAGGYFGDNQIAKAVEAMKKAILVCPPNWKPSKDTLETCLKYMEGQGAVEEAEEFIRLRKEEGIFSAVACDRLLEFIMKDGNHKTLSP